MTFTAAIPDIDHYRGSFGGRVFPLWADAAATRSNLSPGLAEALTKRFGQPVTAEDVLAYIAGIAAHPAYTVRYQAELATPGLRIPMTADALLFAAVAVVGRRVIWLHSYGERMADPEGGRPAGPPRAPAEMRPTIPKEGTIPATMPLPDELRYELGEQRLYLGEGYIDNVAPPVWAYEVDGKQIIPRWFSYRKRDRSKPAMGDKRPPSPLQAIQPEHWLAEYTSDLLDLLNMLTLLVALEPEQEKLLAEVCAGKLFSQDELYAAGAMGACLTAGNIVSKQDEKQVELF